jgi:hypothetical protein
MVLGEKKVENSATMHTGKASMDALREMFGGRGGGIIKRGLCSQHASNRSPHSFNL